MGNKLTQHDRYLKRSRKRMSRAQSSVEIVDGKEVEVTRYPAGCARGYRDVKNWSQRRALGMSGIGKIDKRI